MQPALGRKKMLNETHAMGRERDHLKRGGRGGMMAIDVKSL